jgi:8-oxo-dGTP pyrophosphatase MutT (NUDIX family)
MTTYARRSARVIVVDEQNRVLLLRLLLVRGKPGRGHAWFTPGGGVEDGEELPAAAARELAEEVGLVTAPGSLRPIAFTTGYADLGWAKGQFRDDFFLLRVGSHEVDTAGHTRFERAHYAGHRWWTAAQLRETTETVYPFGLADLLTGILTDAAAPSPVELPWHH